MTWASRVSPWSDVTPESASRGLGLTSDESGWRMRKIESFASPIVDINDALCTLTRRIVDEPISRHPWIKRRFITRTEFTPAERRKISGLIDERDRYYAKIADALLEETC